jgi:ribosome modulation factor
VSDERQSLPPRQIAADLLGPRRVLTTQAEGYLAALEGRHADACPWKLATDDREVALRQMWVRGYAAGRTDLRTGRARS